MRNGARVSNGDTPNSYARDMDAALAESPPEIRWERRSGVMVAIEVDDPHTATKTAAQRLEQARLRLRKHQQEADEVAERFRKHRVDNTPLMNAARTEI